jgi:hypothetical protein
MTWRFHTLGGTTKVCSAPVEANVQVTVVVPVQFEGGVAPTTRAAITGSPAHNNIAALARPTQPPRRRMLPPHSETLD